MGCKKSDMESVSCVRDILEEIADAQDDIKEYGCDTSCKQSINDLLGETNNGNDLDTVPVILYNKDGSPFKGFGANQKHRHHKVGPIVASFIFRVKKVDEDGCAILELLLSDEQDCSCDHLKDPADQKTHDLEGTGICITVDLDCFCHVTCLPAISVFN